jgi:hypothetical protein
VRVVTRFLRRAAVTSPKTDAPMPGFPRTTRQNVVVGPPSSPLREQDVAGSNPVAPTLYNITQRPTCTSRVGRSCISGARYPFGYPFLAPLISWTFVGSLITSFVGC